MYIYPGGQLVLQPYNVRRVYMGYNTKDIFGETKFTYYRSGLPGMDQLDRAPSNTGKCVRSCLALKKSFH